MPSTFGWVDVDEASRRKMLDVVHMFATQDTLDELGIGTVRDALADYFFPGTSTIQTRAKYFLFIPWIYRQLEKKEVPSAEIAEKAWRDEMRLIEALLAGGLGENDGIIGRVAREKLQRLPSNIYWVGLKILGLRQFSGSQDQYHRSLDQFYRRKEESLSTAEVEGEPAVHANNWHPNLPKAPEGWLEEATMELGRGEAQYLKERILISQPESLLTALVKAETLHESSFLWDNPVAQRAGPAIQEHVRHARNFAELIHGAALLYNFMLASARKNKELIKEYGDAIKEWGGVVEKRRSDLGVWRKHIGDFWESQAILSENIPQLTKKFVEDWSTLALKTGSSSSLTRDGSALELIRKREIETKRQRARLQNGRYLELWNGTSNANMLDFRWGKAFRIAMDVREGLGRA